MAALMLSVLPRMARCLTLCSFSYESGYGDGSYVFEVRESLNIWR